MLLLPTEAKEALRDYYTRRRPAQHKSGASEAALPVTRSCPVRLQLGLHEFGIVRGGLNGRRSIGQALG